MKRSKYPMEVLLWFSAMCRETHPLIFFGTKEKPWVMADLSTMKHDFPSRLSQMKRTSVQRTTHWDRLLPELTSLLVSQWYMFSWLYIGIPDGTEVLLRNYWISFDTGMGIFCLCFFSLLMYKPVTRLQEVLRGTNTMWQKVGKEFVISDL